MRRVDEWRRKFRKGGAHSSLPCTLFCWFKEGLPIVGVGAGCRVRAFGEEGKEEGWKQRGQLQLLSWWRECPSAAVQSERISKTTNVLHRKVC